MHTQPNAMPPRAALPTARSAGQVLVIERDAALRAARAGALQRDGYAVTVAGTGAEAAAALDRQTFDVLSAAGTPDVMGVAPAFRAAVGLALRAADTPSPVCLLGESGTGKELLARLIHATSARAAGPFVAASCTVPADARLDADLFGYRHAAGRGATGDRAGLIESAHGGTLFIDELLDLSPVAQAGLARLLQDGAVRRLGVDGLDAMVDVRIIAATKGDLERARRMGTLRDDLYYRLRVVPIAAPPLRARLEDVPLLAEHFLSAFWQRRGGDPSRTPSLSAPALAALAAHPWRGNVRELQQVMEHAAVVAEPAETIVAEQLDLQALDSAPAGFAETYHAARDRVLAEFETRYLAWLVRTTGGNLSRAARVAGVDRTTLYRVMERHGLHRDAPRAGVVWRP